MSIIDLIIIYLACGAPFAVYKLTKLRSYSRRSLPGVLAAFLFWPLSSMRALMRPSPLSTQDTVTELLSLIEHEALSAATPSRIFAFRETAARFVGLSRAAGSDLPNGYRHEIFVVDGHPDPGLASAILMRRERNHLRSHLALALVEFTDLLNSLSLDNELARAADEMVDGLLSGSGVSRPPAPAHAGAPAPVRIEKAEVVRPL